MASSPFLDRIPWPSLLLSFSASLLCAFPHHFLFLLRSLVARLLNGLAFLLFTSLAILAVRILFHFHGQQRALAENEAPQSPSLDRVAAARRRRKSGNVMLEGSVCEAAAESEVTEMGEDLGGSWKEGRLERRGEKEEGQDRGKEQEQDGDGDQEQEEEKALEEALVMEVEKQRKGETAEMRAAMMALMNSRELGRHADAFISKFRGSPNRDVVQ